MKAISVEPILPSKPKPNPREHCNYVTMKDDENDLNNSEEVPMEKGREITMVSSKENKYGRKTAKFVENDCIEIPTIFPPKLPDPGSFSIPRILGKVGIKRGLCDFGASIGIMPYSLYHKHHQGPLLATPFSL